MGDERPEILDVDTEREILHQRLCDHLDRTFSLSLRPELTVGNDAHIIAGMAVAGMLHLLRVMSARQVAVLLADEANRHERWTIHEPPHYTEA